MMRAVPGKSCLRVKLLAIAVIGLITVFAAGCGGDDDSASEGTTAASTSTAATTPAAPGEPAQQARDPGSFGREATAAERRAATETVDGFLDSRASRDWDETCSHLSETLLEQYEEYAKEVKEVDGPGCAASLELIAESLPLSDGPDAGDQRRFTHIRVKGNRAIAFYENENGSWAMALVREHGGFKGIYLTGFPQGPQSPQASQ